jgi:hypothetical protein
MSSVEPTAGFVGCAQIRAGDAGGVQLSVAHD